MEGSVEDVAFENALGGKDGDRRLLGESYSGERDKLEQRPRGRLHLAPGKWIRAAGRGEWEEESNAEKDVQG